MKVKKAIVPAAGLGTRFLPATKSQPKEMLPVFDKPAIQYTIEEAVRSGIEEILIVTGRGKQTIENHFDRSFELEYFLEQKGELKLLREVQRIGQLANIFYVRQKEPLGLGHAILCGKSFIDENEPFALFLADDLIVHPRPAMSQLISVFDAYNSPVIAVEKIPPAKIGQYGVIRPKKISSRVYQVLDMVEKPQAREAPSNLGIVGRYILTQDIFSILEETKRGKGGEIQLTDALRHLVRQREIYACEFEGRRFDLGNKLDYTKAAVEFALGDPEVRAPLLSYLKKLRH